jgi:hypothetical protein
MSAVRRVAFHLPLIRLSVCRLTPIRQHMILEYPKRRGRMAVGKEADRVEDIVLIEPYAGAGRSQDSARAAHRRRSRHDATRIGIVREDAPGADQGRNLSNPCWLAT